MVVEINQLVMTRSQAFDLKSSHGLFTTKKHEDILWAKIFLQISEKIARKLYLKYIMFGELEW